MGGFFSVEFSLKMYFIWDDFTRRTVTGMVQWRRPVRVSGVPGRDLGLPRVLVSNFYTT